jgi:hypothetical protein
MRGRVIAEMKLWVQLNFCVIFISLNHRAISEICSVAMQKALVWNLDKFISTRTETDFFPRKTFKKPRPIK